MVQPSNKMLGSFLKNMTAIKLQRCPTYIKQKKSSCILIRTAWFHLSYSLKAPVCICAYIHPDWYIYIYIYRQENARKDTHKIPSNGDLQRGEKNFKKTGIYSFLVWVLSSRIMGTFYFFCVFQYFEIKKMSLGILKSVGSLRLWNLMVCG